jgi:hypothetical protein
MDLDEIWYGLYAIGVHPKILILYFLPSVAYKFHLLISVKFKFKALWIYDFISIISSR